MRHAMPAAMSCLAPGCCVPACSCISRMAGAPAAGVGRWGYLAAGWGWGGPGGAHS
jgi:hypothetical protein